MWAEEKLDSIEVGVKATLFDNRLNLNVAAYYGEWENQKGRSTFAINESCKTQADLDDNSIDCDFIGDFKKIAGTDQAFFNARNADVAGDAEIHGLEIEFRKLFGGTANGYSTHLREVAKEALTLNAAIIFTHNHPSGDCN